MTASFDIGIGENARTLRGAYQTLKGSKRADDRGKIFTFCAAKSGCGTSYVARNMALIASQNLQEGEQILLVDMDIQNNTQSQYFFTPQSSGRFGEITGPYDASLNVTPFWRVTPSVIDDPEHTVTNAHYMSLHMLGNFPIMFTHFHWEYCKQGQNVHIQNARNYWHALRDHFSVIIVDTPALDRADILNAICPEADANVLVTTSREARSQNLSDAAVKILDMGAKCSGVIVNQIPVNDEIYGGQI